MSRKLERSDLLSLERYAEERPEFRRRVMEHKKRRAVPVGPNATLIFEDRLTVHYQVQEMLRAERIFEPEAIQDELDAYNPLIPEGRNWKATLMIEFPDPEERRQALKRLRGLEHRVWVRVDGLEPIWGIADEDLEREDEEKTSAVHFLRFELDDAAVEALRQGAPLAVGIDHPEYRHACDPVPEEIREALLADLD